MTMEVKRAFCTLLNVAQVMESAIDMKHRALSSQKVVGEELTIQTLSLIFGGFFAVVAVIVFLGLK